MEALTIAHCGSCDHSLNIHTDFSTDCRAWVENSEGVVVECPCEEFQFHPRDLKDLWIAVQALQTSSDEEE